MIVKRLLRSFGATLGSVVKMDESTAFGITETRRGSSTFARNTVFSLHVFDTQITWSQFAIEHSNILFV